MAPNKNHCSSLGKSRWVCLKMGYNHQIHPNAILMRKSVNKVVNCGNFQTQLIPGNDPQPCYCHRQLFHLLASCQWCPSRLIHHLPNYAPFPNQKWQQLVPAKSANVSNVETKKRRQLVCQIQSPPKQLAWLSFKISLRLTPSQISKPLPVRLIWPLSLRKAHSGAQASHWLLTIFCEFCQKIDTMTVHEKPLDLLSS